jgi:hypothetical protein
MTEQILTGKINIMQRHIGIIEEELDFLSAQNTAFSFEKENVNFFVKGQTLC